MGVVVPTHNRADALNKCLTSLKSELGDSDFVVAVDAGSSDETARMLASRHPDVTCIRATPDDWWAALVNRGVEYALSLGATHVLTLNDDTVVLSGTINRLKAAAAGRPRGIFSSVCCYLQAPDRVFFAGRVRARWLDRFHYLNHGDSLRRLPSGLRHVDLLHGMCTLFPSEIFNDVGRFDARAFPHLFADDDLVLRAARAGFRSYVVLESVVLNDRRSTGSNPYDRRLSLPEALSLLTSRRSAFELRTRSRFLWRHRRHTLGFVLTWSADYARLFVLLLLRWLLPDRQFQGLSANWVRYRGKR